jgi:hypothetical protein
MNNNFLVKKITDIRNYLKVLNLQLENIQLKKRVNELLNITEDEIYNIDEELLNEEIIFFENIIERYKLNQIKYYNIIKNI